jgi:hypothetical protein
MGEKLDLNDPIAVLLATLKTLENASIRAVTLRWSGARKLRNPHETKDADLALASTDADSLRNPFATSNIDAVLTFETVRSGGNLVSRFTLLQ